MKKFILLLFITIPFVGMSQIKIGSGAKLGMTLANFTDGVDTIKSKLDYDIAFEVFAKINKKWTLGLELDNCTYGTRAHNPDKSRKIRVHLYYANLRLTGNYHITEKLVASAGWQYSINYYGRTVVVEGIGKFVTGEDDFASRDSGPFAELRYQLYKNAYFYANGYYGLNQINLKKRDQYNVHNIAAQFGLGVYFGNTWK